MVCQHNIDAVLSVQDVVHALIPFLIDVHVVMRRLEDRVHLLNSNLNIVSNIFRGQEYNV
jgi:hypothetical protein